MQSNKSIGSTESIEPIELFNPNQLNRINYFEPGNSDQLVN